MTKPSWPLDYPEPAHASSEDDADDGRPGEGGAIATLVVAVLIVLVCLGFAHVLGSL